VYTLLPARSIRIVGWKFIDAHENTELVKIMLGAGVQKIEKCHCFYSRHLELGHAITGPASSCVPK